MANSFLTPDEVSDRLAVQVRNSFVMTDVIDPQFVEKFGAQKIGATIKYARPTRYIADNGPVITTWQDIAEPEDTITIDQQKKVPVRITSQDLTLSLDQFMEKHGNEMANALANKVEVDLQVAMGQGFFHSVGTPGTTPASLASLLEARKWLRREAVPDGMIHAIVDEDASAALTDALKGSFDPTVARESVRRGFVGQISGFQITESQNVYRHTVGAYAGTPLMNGATASGATSLVTDGWSTSVTGLLLKGDVITIAGVNHVNPISKQSTGQLMQFTVTADVDSDGSGNATIPVSPAPVDGSGTGQFQNVTAMPADGAAITVFGTAGQTYPQNLIVHPWAASFVTVPLENVDAPFSGQSSFEGVNIRIVRSFDLVNDQNQSRFDILYGVKATYGELGVRLWG